MRIYTKPPEPQPKIVVIEMTELEAKALQAWLNRTTYHTTGMSMSGEAADLNSMLYNAITGGTIK